MASEIAPVQLLAESSTLSPLVCQRHVAQAPFRTRPPQITARTGCRHHATATTFGSSKDTPGHPPSLPGAYKGTEIAPELGCPPRALYYYSFASPANSNETRWTLYSQMKSLTGNGNANENALSNSKTSTCPRQQSQQERVPTYWEGEKKEVGTEEQRKRGNVKQKS